MLDEFRSTNITWDKATSRIYSPVTANESDENGRKLVVQIVNSGQVEDLTGATLHLYWETRDKLRDGLDVFEAVDLKKGEFELSYTTGMLSNQGVLNANLVLIDTVGRVVSERFKITVTEGIDNDAIQSEDSFSSLTQALIDISNLEQNYAPRLNDLTAQLQQTEQELSSQLAQNMKFSGQADFVNIIKDHTNYKDIFVHKNNYGLFITYCDGDKTVSHVIKKEINDDYMKWNETYLGNGGLAIPQVMCGYSNKISTTGTWVDGGAIDYTTQVGAAFTSEVQAPSILFNHHRSGDGGLFEFVIDGDIDNPITVSTHSNARPVGYTLLATGLDPKVKHTVVGTFLGADPNNPPSSGTARGWVQDDESKPHSSAIVGTIENFNDNVSLLTKDSNRDFAFNITYNGVTTRIPDHGVGSAFNIDTPKFLVDGKSYTFEEFELFKVYPCSSLQLIQHIHGRVNGTNVAEIWTEHNFGVDGMIAVNGKFKALADFVMADAYVPMLPLNYNVINTAVSSIGNTHTNNNVANTGHQFIEEGEFCTSVCGVDATRPHYITAFTIDYPLKSNRIGIGENKLLYSKVLSNTYNKVYNRVYTFESVTAGDTYNWFNRFGAGFINNIYNYIV